MTLRRLLICTGLILAVGCDTDKPLAPPSEDTEELSPDGVAPDVLDPDQGELVADVEPEELIIEGPRELLNGTQVKIGHIIDGDTLDVLVGIATYRRYNVRLKGLAAPECTKVQVNTPFGRRWQCGSDDELWGLASWEGLKALAADQVGFVTCDDVPLGAWCPTDDYDRYLAYIEVNGRDLATEMAFQGHAFSYTSFASSKRALICAAEYKAQDAKRGMWKLGSVSTVINQMSEMTQNWYFSHHDRRCDAAINP